MTIIAEVHIDGSAAATWSVLTDIEGAAETISGIEQVEILERPATGLVGLRWRETRTMFGKTATEVMWITAAVEYESYTARAESHGSVYLSTLRVAEEAGGVSLSMSHETQPQSLAAKVLSVPMGLVFQGAMRKLLRQDLRDIKAAVERSSAAAPSGSGRLHLVRADDVRVRPTSPGARGPTPP